MVVKESPRRFGFEDFTGVIDGVVDRVGELDGRVDRQLDLGVVARSHIHIINLADRANVRSQ